MKTKIISAVVAVVTTLAYQAEAQTYDTNNEVVQTFAGFGIPGYVDGQGQFTAFSSPSQIVSDTASNLYVWDSGNFRIRKSSRTERFPPLPAAELILTVTGPTLRLPGVRVVPWRLTTRTPFGWFW